MQSKEELVHVFMVTYNHENYIAQAIESVLMQKTNFAFRLIIGEDCSTDGTREIVKQFSNNYPDKITAFLNEKNFGIRKNSDQIFEACTAKYMALLEGDDYWTDPYKLQKQVTFLEKNEDTSLIFTNLSIIKENGIITDNIIKNKKSQWINIEDILNQFISTCTIVFRKEVIYDILKVFKSNNVFFGDGVIVLMSFNFGKIYYLSDNTAVYKNHSQGITKLTNEEFFLNSWLGTLSTIIRLSNKENKKSLLKSKSILYDRMAGFYLSNLSFFKFLKYLILSFWFYKIRPVKEYKDSYYRIFRYEYRKIE